MRVYVAVLLSCVAATPLLSQQEFQPPRDQAVTPRFRLGLFGFGVQGGIDFTGDEQLVLGTAVDLGDLYTDRLRMRATGELGRGGDGDTYVINGELVYRFVADTILAVPYVGAGVALFSQEACDSAPGCPGLWLQFALGFEIKIREPISWLLEYHSEDAFRRHRLLFGLTTRRVR